MQLLDQIEDFLVGFDVSNQVSLLDEVAGQLLDYLYFIGVNSFLDFLSALVTGELLEDLVVVLRIVDLNQSSQYTEKPHYLLFHQLLDHHGLDVERLIVQVVFAAEFFQTSQLSLPILQLLLVLVHEFGVDLLEEVGQHLLGVYVFQFANTHSSHHIYQLKEDD